VANRVVLRIGLLLRKSPKSALSVVTVKCACNVSLRSIRALLRLCGFFLAGRALLAGIPEEYQGLCTVK